jgi:hypothetical protein
MAIFTTQYSFSRPADTTQYAQNDLVANSATAASVVPLSFGVNRFGGGGIVRGARLYKSDKTATLATFTIFLFLASPGTPSNGDNGALAVASAADFLDSFAIDLATGAFAGATTGIGKRSAALAIPFFIPAMNSKIYGLIRVDAAYTPASEESFRLMLEIERT